MTENRKQIWDEYSGVKTESLRRTFLDYDRYYEANCIVSELQSRNVKFADLSVLDYGCAVGDYGITLARQGATAMFFDLDPAAIEFVRYRFLRENLPWTDYDHTIQCNFPIFGEVLEHIDHPAELLQDYIDEKVKYLLTSSYPYRSDDADDPYWLIPDHKDSARIEQGECRKLLEDNFSCVTFKGALKLWTR